MHVNVKILFSFTTRYRHSLAFDSLMKKLIMIIVLTFLTLPAFASSTVRDFLFPTYTTPSGATIVLDKLKGIYLIKPTAWELTFLSKGTTAADLAATQPSWAIIINAGYFWRDANGFFPAGHFSLDATVVDQSHCDRDPNLCGYIFTDNLTIAEDLTFTKEPTIAAWPIMMLDGIVNKEIQQPRSHRQRKTYRTILIQTAQWPFFMVTKKQYTLDRLLAYTVKTFGRSISVINLDGGSSTSLRTDNSAFQINSARRLPTFFILR